MFYGKLHHMTQQTQHFRSLELGEVECHSLRSDDSCTVSERNRQDPERYRNVICICIYIYIERERYIYIYTYALVPTGSAVKYMMSYS